MTSTFQNRITERQSNFELLRIIAMLAIIVYHACWHTREVFQGASIIMSDFICSITIFHVTLFVLITGYFGVVFNWKTFLKILLPCFFIGLVIYLIRLLLYDDTVSFKEWFYLLCPFISSKWWFVTSYFKLLIISPLLNLINSKTTVLEHFVVLFVFAFICFIYGGWLLNPIDDTGQSAFHFAFVYEIGSFINKYIKKHGYCVSVNIQKKYFLGIGICILAIFAKFVVDDQVLPPPFIRFRLYNNPFVLAGAIMIFLFFHSIEIHSRDINFFAKYSFFVYLLHDEEKIIRPLFCNFLEGCYLKIGDFYFVFIFCFAIILYLILAVLYRYSIEPIVRFTYDKLVSKDLFLVLQDFLYKTAKRVESYTLKK